MGKFHSFPFPIRIPTAKDLNVSTEETGLPVVIINDGRVLEHNLHTRGYDENWLEKQLKAHGVKHPQDVYLLTSDELGRTYFAPKEEEK